MPYKDKEQANAAARRRYAESAELRAKRTKSAAAWKAAHPDAGRKASLAWYHRNAEAVTARQRAKYAKNREAEIERTLAWRAANPERSRQTYATWRANNPEKYRDAVRRWNEANPDKVRDYSNRRRARKIATAVGPIDEAAIFERDGWDCQLCLLPVDPTLHHPDPSSASLDHIVPVSKGGAHVSDNVQLAHLRCNLVKGNRGEEVMPSCLQ